MWKRWNNHDWIVSKGAMWAMWGGLCWCLGIIFAVLGIIADAANINLGLTSTSWLLLAIATFVVSAIWYLSWAVAVQIDALKAKKQE
ncbi:hypothetical protein ACFLYC_01670 [Chloroflexota bacterium]